MSIALWLVLGVILGVGWLARSVPPCLRCRYRGRCDAEVVCTAKMAPHPLKHWLVEVDERGLPLH